MVAPGTRQLLLTFFLWVHEKEKTGPVTKPCLLRCQHRLTIVVIVVIVCAVLAILLVVVRIAVVCAVLRILSVLRILRIVI